MLSGISGMNYANMIEMLPKVAELNNILHTSVATGETKSVKTAKTAGEAKSEVNDVFMLSPSAQQLSDFFASQEVMDKESGNFDTDALKTKGDTLSDLLKMQLETFRLSLTQSLQTQGVDVDRPINLQTGSDGKIQVTNSHPDTQKIESFFDRNPNMTQQFKEIALIAGVMNSRTSQLNSGDVNNVTPISTAMRYAQQSLSGGIGSKFSLEIGPRSAHHRFVR